MTHRLARRITELEQRKDTGQSIVVFRATEADDEKVKAAELEAQRTGKSLLVIRWQAVAPDHGSGSPS